MRQLKRHMYFLLISILPCFVGMPNSLSEPSKRVSINLKLHSVVLGPEVTLGDVSHILMRDGITKAKLVSIKIGNAPPPGESSDIQLSYIKRCVKVAGFEKYSTIIKGPRTIRVRTAQFEIDKALLREEFARVTETLTFVCAYKKNLNFKA